MFARSVDAAAGDSAASAERERPADSVAAAESARWKRLASLALGATLVVLGLKRRSLLGAAIAVAGGWLSYRAINGGDRGTSSLESVAPVDRVRSAVELRGDPMAVTQSVTIGRPADELAAFVQDADHLDRIVGPAVEIASLNGDRQRWTVRTRSPLDRRLSWEARVLEDDGEVRWHPIGGSALLDELDLEFAEASGDRGTKVTARTRFAPPGGDLGRTVVDRLDVAPEAIVSQALDRFKSLAETGEIPTTTAGNPSARGTGDLL